MLRLKRRLSLQWSCRIVRLRRVSRVGMRMMLRLRLRVRWIRPCSSQISRLGQGGRDF